MDYKTWKQAGYDLARQRFEYVIQLDPNYPGVTDKLADVLVQINITATPTIVVTPTPSPTPDLRGVEELFTTARDHMTNLEWDPAINALLTLRKKDPNYQAVAVDGMLYIAFRNRGTDKILKTCDLEEGIFDLSQAEQFGPLDTDANSYITWASLYSTGASFWDLDWAQAVYYFAQVGPALPNLCDGSGLTAGERYRLALVGYGDFLGKNGDWCAAAEQFTAALALGADTTVEEALSNANNQCNPRAGRTTASTTSGNPNRHHAGGWHRGRSNRDDASAGGDAHRRAAALRAFSYTWLMTPPSIWALSLAYWLHMLATVAWIGGLVTLSLLVLPAARQSLDDQAYAGLIGTAAPPAGPARLGLPDRAGGDRHVPDERQPQLPGFPGSR